MKRDSLYGEPVLWSGRPKDISTPPMYGVASAVCGVTSAITTAAAVVLSTALDAAPDGLLGFAAWMATLAVAFYFGPRWWRSELLFTLTDQHIVLRRGRLRRSINRREISYARIHWNPRLPGIGDLEIVRAVPTGATRVRVIQVGGGRYIAGFQGQHAQRELQRTPGTNQTQQMQRKILL